MSDAHSDGRTAGKLKLAVLISGGGRTLKNLIVRIQEGRLDAQIKLVVSNTSTAGGLKFAQRAKIEQIVVDPTEMKNPEEFSAAVFEPCRGAGIDLVVMAGFIRFVPIPPDYENRVVNIHPALIPAFCGKGFYGEKVHRAVLEYGAKVSGCTVHFVDNEYDHGPIILQKTVPVLDDDTPESLSARVFEMECEAYPEAIQLIAEGRVRTEGRHVRLSAKYRYP